MPRPLPSDAHVVVLSGAGLSKASGIPTFRDADGLWEGHDPMQVATPEAWRADRDLVRRFYDERRTAAAVCTPNPGHKALARLQQALGARVTLITQNIDNLLTEAGCTDVIEMHGSLFHLRCEADQDHPWLRTREAQQQGARCAVCGHGLRPAVVWFGEIPLFMERIEAAMSTCDVFVSVGTSGLVYPAAGLVQVARLTGAWTVEVNPEPSGARFHEVLAEGSETALPGLIDGWLEGLA